MFRGHSHGYGFWSSGGVLLVFFRMAPNPMPDNAPCLTEQFSLTKEKNLSKGFNAQTGQYVDMIEAAWQALPVVAVRTPQCPIAEKEIPFGWFLWFPASWDGSRLTTGLTQVVSVAPFVNFNRRERGVNHRPFWRDSLRSSGSSGSPGDGIR